MPVHDWARVDANVFHHFHQRWTIAICDALNAGLLPSGYSALVEQHAGGLVPDVLALERRFRPSGFDEHSGGIVTATPPKTRLVRQAKVVLAARANRIVIRRRLGDVVCVLEIVSPGDKSGRAALRAFVEKAIEFLRQGVHLLVIDILPPTSRDPRGTHKAIWDEIEEEAFELLPGKPLTLAAYVAGDLLTGRETTAYIELVGVGDTLPNMPAYIDPNGYVPVPLEATYQAAWATCPADLRELVETGRLSDGDD
ncbi:MAG: DUF4058 family protein [Pirellulaceae bacterium]|jgi:hypothetical protein|nr:DUF4058 family protein [Pirellulaceae bacterium]MCU0981821.1 DUF4058 family protein [Pirellulaceae bacterium]